MPRRAAFGVRSSSLILSGGPELDACGGSRQEGCTRPRLFCSRHPSALGLLPNGSPCLRQDRTQDRVSAIGVFPYPHAQHLLLNWNSLHRHPPARPPPTPAAIGSPAALAAPSDPRRYSASAHGRSVSAPEGLAVPQAPAWLRQQIPVAGEEHSPPRRGERAGGSSIHEGLGETVTEPVEDGIQRRLAALQMLDAPVSG